MHTYFLSMRFPDLLRYRNFCKKFEYFRIKPCFMYELYDWYTCFALKGRLSWSLQFELELWHGGITSALTPISHLQSFFYHTTNYDCFFSLSQTYCHWDWNTCYYSSHDLGRRSSYFLHIARYFCNLKMDWLLLFDDWQILIVLSSLTHWVSGRTACMKAKYVYSALLHMIGPPFQRLSVYKQTWQITEGRSFN